MEKGTNNNGYDYVDLGLPSGTLWASCNVGARKPSESGLYFQWGDTNGYTKEQVEKDKRFYWTDYKFSINRSSSNFSKYTSEGETLELEDDAAQVNMGGSWHMPSFDQIKELIENATSTRTTLDDVSGMTFTSKKDESKAIFIPAAGNAFCGKINDIGLFGYIWSSMLGIFSIRSGRGLCFDLVNAYSNFSVDRDSGCSVRGVIG